VNCSSPVAQLMPMIAWRLVVAVLLASAFVLLGDGCAQKEERRMAAAPPRVGAMAAVVGAGSSSCESRK